MWPETCLTVNAEWGPIKDYDMALLAAADRLVGRRGVTTETCLTGGAKGMFVKNRDTALLASGSRLMRCRIGGTEACRAECTKGSFTQDWYKTRLTSEYWSGGVLGGKVNDRDLRLVAELVVDPFHF